VENKKPDSEESGSAVDGVLFGGGAAYALSASLHRSRAGGFNQARLPAAIMAAGRTLRRLMERITSALMGDFYFPGKRELCHRQSQSECPKKPGPLLDRADPHN
jgi:hypothetical protein